MPNVWNAYGDRLSGRLVLSGRPGSSLSVTAPAGPGACPLAHPPYCGVSERYAAKHLGGIGVFTRFARLAPDEAGVRTSLIGLRC
jgi:hypothetical protein